MRPFSSGGYEKQLSPEHFITLDGSKKWTIELVNFDLKAPRSSKHQGAYEDWRLGNPVYDRKLRVGSRETSIVNLYHAQHDMFSLYFSYILTCVWMSLSTPVLTCLYSCNAGAARVYTLIYIVIRLYGVTLAFLFSNLSNYILQNIKYSFFVNTVMTLLLTLLLSFCIVPDLINFLCQCIFFTIFFHVFECHFSPLYWCVFFHTK